VLASRSTSPVPAELPKKAKAFYMKETRRTARPCSAPTCWPEGYGRSSAGPEEDDYDKLLAASARRAARELIHWYLELRRFGSVPTPVSAGLERTVSWLTGSTTSGRPFLPATIARLYPKEALACRVTLRFLARPQRHRLRHPAGVRWPAPLVDCGCSRSANTKNATGIPSGRAFLHPAFC